MSFCDSAIELFPQRVPLVVKAAEEAKNKRQFEIENTPAKEEVGRRQKTIEDLLKTAPAIIEGLKKKPGIVIHDSIGVEISLPDDSGYSVFFTMGEFRAGLRRGIITYWNRQLKLSDN